MYATANMLLTSWDQIQDEFNHTQMDSNWKALDQHDHSSGRGVQISTPGIAAQAITSALIAPGAVANNQLATNAVATANVQAGAITSALLAAGAVTSAAIANGSITSADLDPNILPLGTVSLWYRGPQSSVTPGGGWEIMDGRAWSSISNSLGLSTGNIPDMRNVFPLGADINGNGAPAIGITGGSNTVNLAHSHSVNSHSHSVPPHAHTLSSDGGHLHSWQGGLEMWSRANSFAAGLTIRDAQNVQRQNTFYSMYIKNLLSNPNWSTQTDGNADMDAAGTHSHGGATQASMTFRTDGAGSTTDTQLGTAVSVVPRNVALLFIMRVR